MHWAITGQTAAEIVHARADAKQPNMGLTSWRGAKPRKQDVAIAKNYLAEEELLALNNLAEQYLIFAEGQAMRRIAMHMRDWIKKLDAFLNINDRDILTHAGKISHEMAQQRAESEYEQYPRRQIEQQSRLGSDFDRMAIDSAFKYLKFTLPSSYDFHDNDQDSSNGNNRYEIAVARRAA